MYPSSFEYYRPDSVAGAVDLLTEHNSEETELLAGGHSLLPTMKAGLADPDIIIDLGHLESLKGIDVNDDSETATIGALTTYAQIAKDETLQSHTPALTQAAHAVADIQVRNRGTIGGNIAHSDPASDLPAAVLASDAIVHARGEDGTRQIAADDFFLHIYTTALKESEILTKVEVPKLGENDVGTYVKKPNPSSGYAMVGVAAVLTIDSGIIQEARVAANGAFPHATRLKEVEESLTGSSLDAEDLPAVAERAANRTIDSRDTSQLMTDITASSEYRAQLLTNYTRQAVGKTLDRALSS